MEKAYVVYKVNSRELQLDTKAVEMVGVCSTYAKAFTKAQEVIRKEKEENNYLEVGDEIKYAPDEYGQVYYNIVYDNGDEDCDLYTEIIIECIRVDFN